MKPEDVYYTTNLDRDYVTALKEVCDGESLVQFLAQWGYWLDDSAKALKSEDWETLKPMMDDCRTEGVWPEEKHSVAMALIMPERIMRVSITADQFKVPWGCAYIRMKEEKVIKY
jgi:hypothetical protein